MKNTEVNAPLQRFVGRTLGALVAIGFSSASLAAQTDISSTPIVSTTAAQVKPNIMLLVDASQSMGRSHMPDEVESITLPSGVGYKNWQCNALFYNPAQTYTPPKYSTGAFFPLPSFTSAPYAGFVAYYAAPDATDSSSVDLSTAFKPYDAKTLHYPPGVEVTPEAAYYYLYSGPQTPTYATAPCTDADTGVTRPASGAGGGTWTKVVVSATSGPRSTDERQNFATWYSFYRIRISLIKSAASLAFTPLTDSFRVGFITMAPKATRSSPAIDPTRYLGIGDFDTGQRSAWFSKLFSQTPKGTSPAREGLARVGRHYGGKFDSINTGMTGDPVQYSCQQNFTIMTTDGYWNAQEETPTTGGNFGGGLQLDGVTLVGQQDGDPTCLLGSTYCPRPIWDGRASTTRVSTLKTNAYTSAGCSVPLYYRTTAQTTAATSVMKRNTTRTTKRTVQYTETKVQAVASTTQTMKTVDRTTKATDQYLLTVTQRLQETYQVKKSVDQTTYSYEYFALRTSQKTAQTQQTSMLQVKTSAHVEVWQTATSQFQQATSQYSWMTAQYTIGKVQIIKRQFQELARDVGTEDPVPLAGTCVSSASRTCETRVIFGPQAVDPADCVEGVTGPTNLHTTCTSGPLAVPTAPIGSACSVGDTNSGSPNYVVTSCRYAVTSPDAPFNGTCTVGTTFGAGPDYYQTTCTRPAANNVSAFVPSCTVGSTSTGGPGWITTTCSNPAGPNNQPATNSPACSPGSTSTGYPTYITTTCTKPTDANDWVLGSSCTDSPGTSSPFRKTACTPTTVFGPAVVDGSTCANGSLVSSPFTTTTCTISNAGTPYPAPTPVASCTPSYGSNPFYYQTLCVSPAATNKTTYVPTPGCTPGTDPGTSPNGWITTVCTRYAFGPYPYPPNDCASLAAYYDGTTRSGPPYYKVTCTSTNQQPATVVDSRTCSIAAASPGYPAGVTVGPWPNYYVTTCAKNPITPPTPVTSCVPDFGTSPDWIVTACSDANPVVTGTPSCVEGIVDPPTPGNGWRTTTCSHPTSTLYVDPVACAVVTPSSSNGYLTVTCTTNRFSGPVAVPPSSCTAGTGGWPNFYVTSCSTGAAGPYATPTPVATCNAATSPDPDYFVTSCSYPIGTNYANRPVAPCTEGTSTDPATQITTTCAKTVDTTANVVGSSCTADQLPLSGNSFVAITCATAAGDVDVPTPTCTVGSSLAVSPFDTTTSCPVTVLTIATSVSSCTPGVGPGAAYVNTVCGSTPIATGVLDPTCTVPGPVTDGAGVITTCTTGSAGGFKYFVTTTTKVNTSYLSGAAITGIEPEVTTVGATTAVDSICYPTAQTFTAQPTPPAGCTGWPCDVDTAGPGGSVNSVADVAQYYYKTDLRPSLDNNVPSIGNNPEDDKAPHQHMTTFVLGLGVSGTLNYRSDYRKLTTTTGDFAALRCAAPFSPLLPASDPLSCKSWPLWPDPALDYVANNGDAYNNPNSIDDFWHTAVNGRGTYFSAQNPTSVIQGLGEALAGIASRVASGAGDGASSLEPVAGNNFVYTPSYQTGSWQGDLEGFAIDLASGDLVTPHMWSAQALLNTKTADACDSRNIYLIRSGAPDNLIDFTWNTDKCTGGGSPSGSPVSALDSTEKAFFGPTNVSLLSQYPSMTDGTAGTVNQRDSAGGLVTGNGYKLVNFLRGQHGNEGFEANSLTRLFRTRASVLGDIVGSQPVYVKAPFAAYQDAGYKTFALANAGRTPMVYAGANDGMLHAFYAGFDGADALRGQEKWAIIPTAVLPNLYKLADDSYKNNHQFYVDGTAVAGDVYYGSSWRTILVGGLNGGGKGFYAIDVTDPLVAPKALWEFKASSASCPASPAAAVGNTSDCNLGFSFGKPIITKLSVGGTESWVVMLTSGYNNVNSASNGGDGIGYLYVLNAVTGQIIYKISTGVGSATTPSGLAQINNFVDNVLLNNLTLRAYGGDVSGNVWRFEFGATPTAQLIGTAKDPSDNPQPITTRPELAELDGKPFVFLGTGRLLGSTDISDTQIQSIFGIVDPLTSGPVFTNLRGALRPLAMTQVGSGTTAVRTSACTGSATACARTAGWVLDLPEAGERVNVEMKLALGTLVAGTNVPQPIACTVGGHSWFNFFDYRSGLAVNNAPVSVAGVSTSDRQVSQYLADSLIVGYNLIKLPPPAGRDNGTYIAGFHQSDTSHVIKAPPVADPPPIGKRISWREIAQ